MQSGLAPPLYYTTHLRINPTKWSNTLKQFVGNSRTSLMKFFFSKIVNNVASEIQLDDVHLGQDIQLYGD